MIRREPRSAAGSCRAGTPNDVEYRPPRGARKRWPTAPARRPRSPRLPRAWRAARRSPAWRTRPARSPARGGLPRRASPPRNQHASGRDHADDGRCCRDGGDDGGARAEAWSRPTRSRRPMPSNPTDDRGEEEPEQGDPEVLASTCSGRYTDSASPGPPMAAPASPMPTPTTPETAIVIASIRRRRRRSSTRAHTSAPTSAATTSAIDGTTMLASRKPVSSSWITPFDGCVAPAARAGRRWRWRAS